MSHSIFFCPVSMNSVLTGDLHEIDLVIQTVIDEIKRRGDFTPWMLTITGYVADARPLWKIPEVRAWCKSVHAKTPYLPLLISEASIAWYALCVLEIEEVERRKHGNETIGIYHTAPKNLEHFRVEVSLGAGEFFRQKCGLTIETAYSIIVRSSEQLGRALASVLLQK